MNQRMKRTWIRWSLVIVAGSAALGLFAVSRGWVSIGSDRRAREVHALLLDRRLDEAEQRLARWLQERPEDSAAHYYQARLDLARGRSEASVQQITTAFDLGHDRSQLEPLRAIFMAKGGQAERAEPVLRQSFLHGDPFLPEVAEVLVQLSMSRFDFGVAGTVLTTWSTQAPRDPRPYLLRAEIQVREREKPETLIATYGQVLDRDPRNLIALRGTADAYRQNGQFDEARKWYEAALLVAPDDLECLLGVGRVAMAYGDTTSAASSLDKALGLRPDSAEALRERGLVDLRQGNLDQAESRLGQALARAPHDAETRYNLAMVYRRLGKVSEAEQQLARAKAITQANQQMAEIRHKLVQRPKDLELRLQAARWLMEHDEEREGLRWAELILRDDPQHRATHEMLAAYHARTGNRGLANYHRLQLGDSPSDAAAQNPVKPTPPHEPRRGGSE